MAILSGEGLLGYGTSIVIDLGAAASINSTINR
jgi:hypothetical protein